MSESNAPAPQAAAPEQPKQEAPKPLDYRKMIEEAYILAKQSQMNILKVTELMNDVIEKWVTVKEDITQIKKQLAAVYMLSEEGKALTPDNVSAKILEKETEATKRELAFAVEKGALAVIDAVADANNLISFSFEEGGFGYQSVLALSEEDQKAAIGKKAGDSIGQMKIEGVYALTPGAAGAAKSGETNNGTEENKASSAAN